jgi:hypothetical protein
LHDWRVADVAELEAVGIDGVLLGVDIERSPEEASLTEPVVYG